MTKALNLPDVVGEIYKLLDPLESEDRQKIIKSAMMLLGENSGSLGSGTSAGNANPEFTGADDESSFGIKANRWMQQNGIEVSAINDIFHKDDDKVEIIVGEVPGERKKNKTHNCYLLSGVRTLLESDEAKFPDSDAVSLCKHMGCHDQANHAKIRSELGNIVAGTKKGGFTLPAPGLRAAAELIKTMTNDS